MLFFLVYVEYNYIEWLVPWQTLKLKFSDHYYTLLQEVFDLDEFLDRLPGQFTYIVFDSLKVICFRV